MEQFTEYLDGMKKCQRNWDLLSPVPDNHIEQLIEVAHSAPRKNSIRFYSLLVLKSREVINEFAAATDPEVFMDDEDKQTGVFKAVRQGQTRAPVLFAWCIDEEMKEKTLATGAYSAGAYQNIFCYGHIGMSSALTAMYAHKLGYKTGFCQCYKDTANYLEKYGIKGEIVVFLGIGKPHPEYPLYTQTVIADIIDNEEIYPNGKPNPFFDKPTSNESNEPNIPPKTTIL